MNDDLRERAARLEEAVDDTPPDPIIGFERPSDGVLLDADGERFPSGTDPIIVLPADIWGGAKGKRPARRSRADASGGVDR